MLKIGYGLMLTAGAVFVGYVGYRVITFLLLSSRLNIFVKVLILVAMGGVLLTLVGLIVERRREEKHDSGHNE